MGDAWRVVIAPTVVEGRDAVEMVREALGGADHVVIDLTATELLTSEGCQALVEVQTALARDDRRVALRIGDTRIVSEVLRITGLDERFPILSRDEGLQ
jgi:anti-anti-sigma regulatory factor